MFLSRNYKNNVYPFKPQFYYIKWGWRGSKLYRHVFVMVINCSYVPVIFTRHFAEKKYFEMSSAAKLFCPQKEALTFHARKVKTYFLGKNKKNAIYWSSAEFPEKFNFSPKIWSSPLYPMLACLQWSRWMANSADSDLLLCSTSTVFGQACLFKLN